MNQITQNNKNHTQQEHKKAGWGFFEILKKISAQNANTPKATSGLLTLTKSNIFNDFKRSFSTIHVCCRFF
jgi:hypothetical protein